MAKSSFIIVNYTCTLFIYSYALQNYIVQILMLNVLFRLEFKIKNIIMNILQCINITPYLITRANECERHDEWFHLGYTASLESMTRTMYTVSN